MPLSDRATPCPRAAAACLACLYCASYDVGRLYLASARVDSCECHTCGARWDEDAETGEFRGRAATASLAEQPARHRSLPA